MLALHLLVSALLSYAAISLVEYVVHRTFMHHMRLALRLRSHFLKQLCHNHMARHHKKSYRHSSAHDEQDDVRWQVSLAGLLPNILVFIGLKMILHNWVHVPNLLSLGIIDGRNIWRANLPDLYWRLKELAAQSSTARHVAFTAMSSMSDLAVVIAFLRRSTSATSRTIMRSSVSLGWRARVSAWSA